MERKLSIYYTSDIHGYFSPVDYSGGGELPTGLANCMDAFSADGNTLVIDGGDTLQGSPLTYYLYHGYQGKDCVPAQLMNLAGYDFITLGNHDFDYGRSELERYLAQLNARCLCANIKGVQGVEKSAVVTLKNGLRVGLTGVTSHFVRNWESPETMAGITVQDAFEAAKEQSQLLREQNCDLTVCIYHGGYERDLKTGTVITETEENQGCRMALELCFDILLCAHQHMSVNGQYIGKTFTCQGDDKARHYIKINASISSKGSVSVSSLTETAGDHPKTEAWTYLEPIEAGTAAWLDAPMGRLDTALLPETPITMAVNGSYIANFFNQVQLHSSGADISVTSLANVLRGFRQDVSIRDVVASYVFPNTLKTIEVNKKVLKQALERCGEYFDFDEGGKLCVSDRFLIPLEQHFNFDYFAGIHTTMDLRRPIGERVVSIEYKEQELPEDKTLRLCLNNYRASGAGGYGAYRQCRIVKEQPTEIVEMIMDYIRHCRQISVDKTRWLTLIY